MGALQPKVFVILAGTNNLSPTPNETHPQEIAEGINTIINECQRRVPAAKVILTAILPRSDHPAMTPMINEINQRLAHYADGSRIRFVNINRDLTNANGQLKPGMMNDGLHLTRRGYEVWVAALIPILTEWLGPRQLVDHAPPPTGDPAIAGSR